MRSTLLISLITLHTIFTGGKASGSSSNSPDSSTSNDVKLLVFTADLCGQCTQFKPTLESLQKNSQIKIQVTKDEDPSSEAKELRNKHNVQGYPTMIFSVNDSIFLPQEERKEESILSTNNSLKSFSINTFPQEFIESKKDKVSVEVAKDFIYSKEKEGEEEIRVILGSLKKEDYFTLVLPLLNTSPSSKKVSFYLLNSSTSDKKDEELLVYKDIEGRIQKTSLNKDSLEEIALNLSLKLVQDEITYQWLMVPVVKKLGMLFITPEIESSSSFDLDSCKSSCTKSYTSCSENISKELSDEDTKIKGEECMKVNAQCQMMCEMSKDKPSNIIYKNISELESLASSLRSISSTSSSNNIKERVVVGVLNDFDMMGGQFKKMFGFNSDHDKINAILLRVEENKMQKYAFRGELKKDNLSEFVKNVFGGKEEVFFKSEKIPDYSLIDKESEEGLVKKVVGRNLKEFIKVLDENNNEKVTVVQFGAPVSKDSVESEGGDKEKTKKSLEIVKEVARKARKKGLGLEVGSFNVLENEHESVKGSIEPVIKVYGKGAEEGVIYEKFEEKGEEGLVSMILEKFGVDLSEEVETESEDEDEL